MLSCDGRPLHIIMDKKPQGQLFRTILLLRPTFESFFFFLEVLSFSFSRSIALASIEQAQPLKEGGEEQLKLSYY